MKEVCLYDFVSECKKCGEDREGNPVYQEYARSILPNYMVYDRAKENKRENYYYSLLLLYIHYCNKADFIKEGETARSAFERHFQQNDALNMHCETLEWMLMATEHVQQITEARRTRAKHVTTEPHPAEDDDGPQMAGEATLTMNNVFDFRQKSDTKRPSLEELVQSLNTDQARVYKQVKSHLEHQLNH